MRHALLLLLALPALTGCMGLDQKFADARMEWGAALQDQAAAQTKANGELAATIEASSADLAAGLKTFEDHVETIEDASRERDKTIGASVDALKDSVADTWDELKDGVEEDIEEVTATAKGAARGLLGGGPLWDLGAAALASIMGANAARNRNLPGTRRIPAPVKPNSNGDGGSNPS